MRCLGLLALVMIAGCSNPRLGAVIETDGSGVSVSPRATGNLGGLSVSVQG